MASAELWLGLKIRTSWIGRTHSTARTCVRAWTPLPNTASTVLSVLANWSVANPHAAAVLIAVSVAPSISACGTPVLASITSSVPWIDGRPRRALAGKTDTALTVRIPPLPSSSAAVMTSVAPSASPVGTTARGGDWTRPRAWAANA